LTGRFREDRSAAQGWLRPVADPDCRRSSQRLLSACASPS